MMEDQELLDAVWEIAFDGLNKAYILKHDLKEADISEPVQQWAQGKADAFRLILAMMRGHGRFYFKTDQGNEESGDVPDAVREKLDEIRESAARLGIPLLPPVTILTTPKF